MSEAEILDQMRKVTEALSQKQNEAVEAFCLALLVEKGARSVLDYELCQQMLPDGAMKWFFQPKTETE